jgi:ABC-type dipeptide/oligopeptide/nickel transport system ATPase subunit
MQYTLAKLAGARLLLIDEADMLDDPNRSQLINFLLEIQPDFRNILVFATTNYASPSPIPEMQIWVMQAGKVTPLNPGFEYRDGAVVKVREAA